MYEKLKLKLHSFVPDDEIQRKARIAEKIIALKEEKNAVILGHNYMEPALFYSIPDFTGDSLALSRKAAETDRDMIVFCGVRFMAETANILNPEKTVLLPAEKAGCSLAESITAEDVRQLKRMYPGVPVVTYVNTYADVKAETDICCTSGNAVAVVESINAETIIFLPDEYLARNVAQETGRHIIFPTMDDRALGSDTTLDNVLIGWPGRCEVHEQFTTQDVVNVRAEYPDVVVLAHPECSPEVVDASDFAGSTSAMINYVQESNAEHYLMLTECAMADNIAAVNPDKQVLPLCRVRCPHMDGITLEDTLLALQMNRYEISVPEDIRVKAARAVERMIAIG
ncbi:MAG: quinolinate synthase NadA [Chloroflexota bacterium]